MTNNICLESEAQCTATSGCNGIWCTLDAPIDPAASCASVTLRQDIPNYHFSATCSEPTPAGETCTITHQPGYTGGKVECVAGTYVYTAAICSNCCSAGQYTAPGTEALVQYSDIQSEQVQLLNCPMGYDGQFTLLCSWSGGSDYEISLVDGGCSVYCTQEAAQEFYDSGVSDADTSDDGSSGMVVVLGVALVIQFAIMLTYVFYKEEIFCFEKDPEYDMRMQPGAMNKRITNL